MTGSPAQPPIPSTPPADDGPDEAPPTLPPDAVATTVEELPAGFWSDEHDDAGPEPSSGPVPSSGPERSAGPKPSVARTATAAVAELQGLPLLEAVFPGRVLKIERPDPVADPAEAATEPDLAPGLEGAPLDPEETHDADAPDDEAIPLLTPPRRDP